MHLPIHGIPILTLALAVGQASTAPTTISALEASPSQAPKSNTSSVCAYNDRLGPRVAEFTSWITDCGDKSGHTTGMRIAWRGYNGLCFPLPEDTRALEIRDIVGGCRVTAYESPVCSDYPWNGAWHNETGCLWTGNREYHSFMVTCEDDDAYFG